MASGPFVQGRDKGGLRISRLEGSWYSGRPARSTSSTPRRPGCGRSRSATARARCGRSIRPTTSSPASSHPATRSPATIPTTSPSARAAACCCARTAAASRTTFGFGERLLGLTPAGETFVFAKNNVMLEPADIQRAGKSREFIEPGRLPREGVGRRQLRSERRGPVRQHPGPRHHLRDHRPVAGWHALVRSVSTTSPGTNAAGFSILESPLPVKLPVHRPSGFRSAVEMAARRVLCALDTAAEDGASAKEHFLSVPTVPLSGGANERIPFTLRRTRERDLGRNRSRRIGAAEWPVWQEARAVQCLVLQAPKCSSQPAATRYRHRIVKFGPTMETQPKIGRFAVVRMMSAGALGAALLASSGLLAADLTVYTALEADLLPAYQKSFEAQNPDISIQWVRDFDGHHHGQAARGEGQSAGRRGARHRGDLAPSAEVGGNARALCARGPRPTRSPLHRQGRAALLGRHQCLGRRALRQYLRDGSQGAAHARLPGST